MIVFSLQRNKAWNGTGFIMKPGKLELSSMCFAEQSINIGSGKYRIKLIGSSISGNGVFSLRILSSEKEIESKTMLFNSRSNTEVSFDIELYEPGPYRIKLSRGKESIGRISIDLFTLFKTIKKKEPALADKNNQDKTDKTFFIIDYDNISSALQLSDMFVGLKDYGDCFFLLKANELNLSQIKLPNYRLFFEFDEIFDFLSLYTSKEILYIDDNIASSIFQRFGIANYTPISSKTSNTISLSGLLF
mgnify:CR=1 FL=1